MSVSFFHRFIFQSLKKKIQFILTLFKYWKASFELLCLQSRIFFSPHVNALTSLSCGRGYWLCLSSERFKIYRAYGTSLFICSPMLSIFGNGLKIDRDMAERFIFYSCDTDKTLLTIFLEHRCYFHQPTRESGITKIISNIKHNQTFFSYIIYFVAC